MIERPQAFLVEPRVVRPLYAPAATVRGASQRGRRRSLLVHREVRRRRRGLVVPHFALLPPLTSDSEAIEGPVARPPSQPALAGLTGRWTGSGLWQLGLVAERDDVPG